MKNLIMIKKNILFDKKIFVYFFMLKLINNKKKKKKKKRSFQCFFFKSNFKI